MRIPIKISAPCALIALCLSLSGCLVESDIPSSTLISCTADSYCPDGWRCDTAAGLCTREAPQEDLFEDSPEILDASDFSEVNDTLDEFDHDDGSDAPDAIDLLDEADEVEEEILYYEDKVIICEALYDKATACEAETRAALGDELYAVFETDKSTFVESTCVRELLAEASEAEIAEQVKTAPFIVGVSCDYFVTELCKIVVEQFGATPGCQ